jgi:hypothetical protein
MLQMIILGAAGFAALGLALWNSQRVPPETVEYPFYF